MAASVRNTPTDHTITATPPHLPAKTLKRISNGFQLSQPESIKTHQTTKHFILNYKNGTSLYTLPFNYHQQPPTLLTPTQLHLPFNPHLDMFTFHGSCNDLVLVSGYDVDGGHRLIVLNPSTSLFFKIPKSGFDIIDDMREIDIVFGFGYDSVTDDYKVVTVSFYNNDEAVNDVENIVVHVYGVKTDEWRRVCRFRYDHTCEKACSGAFVNGSLHWIGVKDSEEELVRVIVGFSLSDETLSEVALPEFLNDVDVEFKSGIKLVSGDRLVVFVEGDVWVMKEYGVVGSWTKVVLDGIGGGVVDRTVVFYENGEVVVVGGEEMVVYDVEGRLCRRLKTNKFEVGGVCTC